MKLKIDDIIFKKLFTLWQSFGFHITKNHYYSPIPDTRTLKNDLWSRFSKLIGIEMNEGKQIKLLTKFIFKFKNEYDKFPLNRNSNLKAYEYYVNNGGFEAVDGEILYCMIRYFKPRRIFEIGSGNSTYLAAQAICKNNERDNFKCKLIAFEPYPNDVLKSGFPNLSKLVQKKFKMSLYLSLRS